ncbi:MAG TPA: hypothetical protein EYQ00_11550, partial [Dehalococcoidia bacterium]|nr:hypothetical protein [Dehalococcoidia bacterium]
SIRGFQSIDESDMLLIPDSSTIKLDPFNDGQITVIADIKDPVSGEMYNKDPRYVAKKAQEYGSILDSLDGMKEIVSSITDDNTVEMQASCIELVLEGMHLNKLLNKDKLQGEALYRM